jgi:tetratricopeptide (TPR) repeat protein
MHELSPAPTPAAPLGSGKGLAKRLRHFRLSWRITAMALVAVVGAGGYVGWVRTGSPIPEPPEVSFDGIDEAVQNAILHARGQVLKEPRSGHAWGLLAKLYLVNEFEAEGIFCLVQAEKHDPTEPCWPYLRGHWLCFFHEDIETREKGLRLLRQAIQVGEQNGTDMTTAHLALAEALQGMGYPKEAGERFRLVQEREPDNPQLQYNLGLLAYAGRNYDQAVRYLTPVANDSPYRQSAMRVLAKAYESKGDKAKAKQLKLQAEQLPEDGERTNEFLAAVAHLGISNRRRIWKVRALEKRKKYQEANLLLRKMAVDNPSEADSLRERCAENYLAMNSPIAAEHCLRPLLAKGAASPRIRLMLALALFQQADMDGKGLSKKSPKAKKKLLESVDFFREVIRLQPSELEAHICLGRAFLELGRGPEAVLALKLAVKTGPKDATTHLYLGKALAAMNQDEEALKCLARAASLAPGDKQIAAAYRLHEEKMADKKKGAE